MVDVATGLDYKASREPIVSIEERPYMCKSIEVWLLYLLNVFCGGSDVVFEYGCLWAVECRDSHIQLYNYYLDEEGPYLALALGVPRAKSSFGEFHFFLKGGFPFLFLAKHGTMLMSLLIQSQYIPSHFSLLLLSLHCGHPSHMTHHWDIPCDTCKPAQLLICIALPSLAPLPITPSDHLHILNVHVIYRPHCYISLS